jgi:vacuolar-type H+-ATPase subunit E/Vma4
VLYLIDKAIDEATDEAIDKALSAKNEIISCVCINIIRMLRKRRQKIIESVVAIDGLDNSIKNFDDKNVIFKREGA